MMKQKMLTLVVLLTLTVGSNGQKSEVRGVWVPDPQYTDVLKSYSNVIEFVDDLKSLNFNSVFIVAYALNKTIYPSRVLLRNSNYPSLDSTYLLAPWKTTYNHPLKSPTGDPIRDLINESHRRNIKVFFWYEFGFMADIKPATPQNNPILARHPDWIGIGNDGKPANYNNQDYYFNSFDSRVQRYLIDLILEGIKKYPDIDGIQGDDRLPASCINSGYDKRTARQYRKEQGKEPPADFRDAEWVRWRLDKLNAFGKQLYKEVKKKKSSVMVSFAPNPYPWSRDNLMQEWPVWVREGICDLLAVQSYRRDSLSYITTVQAAQKNISLPAGKKMIVAPGVLLMVSGKIVDAEQLGVQLRINRMLNTDGEILFYNEGLRDERIRDEIRKVYGR